jgi:hypothetical protein
MHRFLRKPVNGNAKANLARSGYYCASIEPQMRYEIKQAMPPGFFAWHSEPRATRTTP